MAVIVLNESLIVLQLSVGIVPLRYRFSHFPIGLSQRLTPVHRVGVDLTIVRTNEQELFLGRLLSHDGNAFDGHAQQQLVSLEQLGRVAVEERLVPEQVQYVDIPLVLPRRRAGHIVVRSDVDSRLNVIDQVAICRIEFDQTFSSRIGEQQLLFHLRDLVIQRRDLVGKPVETK